MSHSATLRASGEHSGEDFNLETVIDSAAESGVPHGKLLIEFVEAVVGNDDARLDRARLAIFETLGPEALIDAAGAVASFNAVVKVADGVGLEVDDSRQEMAARMRSELKLDFGPQ